jgi:hypothetical protein
MSYVDISNQDIISWLDSHYGSWSKDQRFAGIYLIHLSDKVGVKLSSTQTSKGTNKARGKASMNLSLVSLVDGSLLNRKARDRKYFQRTTNWRKTWKKGIDNWVKVYEDKSAFYEKISDRAGYKSKWLKLIDSLPMGGSNQKVIEYRDQLEGGGVLWDNQENHLLSLKSQSKRKVNPQLSQPLPVALLRKMWVEARRQQDSQGMESLKDLGQAAARGETPSMADLIAFKSLKKELGF